jgi:hypothetical protein
VSRKHPPLVVAVVSEEVAALLSERDPPRRERLLADPAKLDQMPGRKKPPGKRDPEYLGFPWEGPRFRFEWLLGESAVWAGPGSRWLYDLDWGAYCRFCGAYVRLPENAYCLGCDRSGRDGRIPPPTELDLKKRVEGRKAYRKGKLKGGVA